MERRSFLQNTSAAATTLALFPGLITSCASKSLKSFGVQLFSLPKILEANFRAGIKMLAEIVLLPDAGRRGDRLCFAGFPSDFSCGLLSNYIA